MNRYKPRQNTFYQVTSVIYGKQKARCDKSPHAERNIENKDKATTIRNTPPRETKRVAKRFSGDRFAPRGAAFRQVFSDRLGRALVWRRSRHLYQDKRTPYTQSGLFL